MSKLTVGMITSYQGLNQSDWLWQQTPQPFGVWKNIQMLKNAPQPDVMLMYQYDFLARSTPAAQGLNRWLPQRRSAQSTLQAQTPDLRGVLPKHTIYLLREPPLPEVIETNQRNYEAAKAYCGYISGPDAFAPVPNYMPAIWYHANSFRELEAMPPPEKLNPCSWITSGISRTANHRQRLAFLHQIQAALPEKVEIYGRNLPATIASPGEMKNKWHSMAPYFYNLAIENYADNEWYVSEKLWDALLAWCLPIYYGGSAADKLLPPGSFLRLPSLDEKGVAYVREVIASPEAWHQAQPAIAEARQIILHKLNLLNWLSEFVEAL